MTARAGGGLLLVLAVSFSLFALRALASGCIRLRVAPHGSGVAHCRPESPYWVASLSLLALGLALAVASAKFLRAAGRGSRDAVAER